MKVTRIDPLVGALVVVELVALRQMEAALRGFVTKDLDASTMKSVAGQLIEAPLLRNAVQFDPSGEQGEEDCADGEEMRTIFFGTLDQRVRERQLDPEPPGAPPTIHLGDVHAALDALLSLATDTSKEEGD